MQKIYLDFKIKKAKDGKLTIVASDETLDRMGEVVPIDSWDLKNYKKNPVLLVDHDYKVANIVGRATDLSLDVPGKQLTFSPEFHGLTQLAKEVESMVVSEFAPAVSVGFMPHAPAKDGERVKNELLEISFVAVGANPNALSLAMKSVNADQEKQIEEWVDEKKEEAAAPVIDQETKTVHMSVELFETMKGQIEELAELKEGRVLSGKNRTKILECSTALKQGAALLDDLLEATDTSKGKDGEEQKGREAQVEQEPVAPKKASPAVVRAMQDINRISNIMLSEIKE